MPGVLLWGWDPTNKVWREIIVDSSGRINIGSVADAEISQDTPQNLKHVPHGYYAAGGVYKPFAVNIDGKLLIQTAALDHLNDISDVEVPAPTDGYILYWDAATSLWKCKAISGMEIHGNEYHDPDFASEAALSSHASAATGVHGVGASTVESTSGSQSKVDTHAAVAAPHSGHINHSLATAINDFLVASGAGAFVKKTLAEVKTILNWAADIATHAALTATHGVAGTIAGLADIVSYIATHAGLTTGIHGVGASTVESIAGSQAKVDTHAAVAAPHSGHINHSLATAISDFLVASGAGVFVKRTLAEVKTLLNWAADISTHAALTATHGVAGTIAGLADIVSYIATHAGLTTGVHSFDKSCRVWNNATQSIPNATATALTFNTEKWDTDDIHSTVSNTHLLTCKTAGKYLVLAAMEFNVNATGNRQLYLYLNGTQLQSYDIAWTPPAGSGQFLSAFCVVNLAVNATIQAKVYQNSGANLNSLTVDPYVPQLQMTRLA